MLRYCSRRGGAGVGMQLLGDFDHCSYRLILLVTAVVGAAPMLVYSTVRPPPFELTPHAEEVVYEFGSREYALEFAQRNGAKRIETVGS